MKLPSINTGGLPKPLKWGLVAVGGYLALKFLLLPVLAIVSFALNLVFAGAGLLLIAAIVYALFKR